MGERDLSDHRTGASRGQDVVDANLARVDDPSVHVSRVPALLVDHSLTESGEITLHWRNVVGTELVTQTLTSISSNANSENLTDLYDVLTSQSCTLQHVQEVLTQARNNPNIRMDVKAHGALLEATPQEIVELIDSEVYFVPPSKARDAMLGTYTGGSLLSPQTLPREEGNWAMISMDVVGLGRAHRRSGDHVLRALGPLVHKYFGDDVKLFARDGGDEFVVLVRTQDTGAKEVLASRMAEFKEALSEIREDAFALVDQRITNQAVTATLMRNAYRQDLEELGRRARAGDLDATVRSYITYMLEQYPELEQGPISIANWPRDPLQQEMRLQGVIRELFTPESWHNHYLKRAVQLAGEQNPLLDVRVSVTCFKGELTPEVVQLMRAQNNYEIDHLKNHPHAPVVIGDFGKASDPQKTFQRRRGERLLAEAIMAGDQEFNALRDELEGLIGNSNSQEQTFQIACRLARVTCQDAQNPIGTRYSLGKHLLAGHLHNMKPGERKELVGVRYDLKHSGRWNNVIGPERYDEIVRACCRRAANLFEVERVHTERDGGGTFWQYMEGDPQTIKLKDLTDALTAEYYEQVWYTAEKYIEHLSLLARLEKHGLEVLGEVLGTPVPFGRFREQHSTFPQASAEGVYRLIIRSEESEESVHDRFEALSRAG